MYLDALISGGIFVKRIENHMTATMTQSPVKLTNAAIEEVKRLMAEPDFDKEQSLRIGVKGGGCSGMSYVLGFDGKEEDDVEYEIEGIPVMVKTSHSIYLFGMEVNFENGLNARGFTFSNPNASSTCGCGSSFAV
jgi:iron-sulfur cluster assembly protein